MCLFWNKVYKHHWLVGKCYCEVNAQETETLSHWVTVVGVPRDEWDGNKNCLPLICSCHTCLGSMHTKHTHTKWTLLLYSSATLTSQKTINYGIYFLSILESRKSKIRGHVVSCDDWCTPGHRLLPSLCGPCMVEIEHMGLSCLF